MTPGQLLVTPTWLGRTALAVVALVMCGVGAAWQYARAADQLAVARAAAADPAPYEDVVTTSELPFEVLGREVVMTADPVPGLVSTIRDRLSPSGAVGELVVQGFRLPDGSVVAVQLGWRPEDRGGTLPPGSADISGRVQPDENFYADAPIAPEGPLVTVTAAGLVAQWRQTDPGIADRLRPGYVVAEGAPLGMEPVAPVFGADPDVQFPLQNVFYSLQWVIFAGFVVVIWVRWFRADLAEARQGAADGVDAVA